MERYLSPISALLYALSLCMMASTIEVAIAENQDLTPMPGPYVTWGWPTVAKTHAEVDSEQERLEQDLAQSMEGVYGEIVKDSERVEEAQPASEYRHALLWLAYGYGRITVNAYAVIRRTLEALRKILAQIEDITKDQQSLEAFVASAADQPDQAWLTSLALDTELVRRQVKPIVVIRLMLRAQLDLRKINLAVWKQLYHLCVYYIQRHRPRKSDGTVEIGQAEFIKWARRVSHEYHDREVDTLKRLAEELQDGIESLPHDHALYKDRLKLQVLVDKFIEPVVPIRHDIGPEGLGLVEFSGDEAMSAPQLSTLVPNTWAEQVDALGEQLRDEQSTAAMSWHWQDRGIYLIRALMLFEFEENVRFMGRAAEQERLFYEAAEQDRLFYEAAEQERLSYEAEEQKRLFYEAEEREGLLYDEEDEEKQALLHDTELDEMQSLLHDTEPDEMQSLLNEAEAKVEREAEPLSTRSDTSVTREDTRRPTMR